ncbi:hypothetical protein [Bacillus sp. FJAT-42315]|uniref:hypothetical protein n=1 Tax=Bacillus sp. FJAT-42315 TaxID=2014077 RepID=UPI00148263AF|nr:hypothetical protein [Bacillus sp. FJAT-42315]
MKVFIGSIIVILLLGFGVWLMLSPSFKRVGDTAYKLKKKLKEDDNGKHEQHKG